MHLEMGQLTLAPGGLCRNWPFPWNRKIFETGPYFSFRRSLTVVLGSMVLTACHWGFNRARNPQLQLVSLGLRPAKSHTYQSFYQDSPRLFPTSASHVSWGSSLPRGDTPLWISELSYRALQDWVLFPRPENKNCQWWTAKEVHSQAPLLPKASVLFQVPDLPPAQLAGGPVPPRGRQSIAISYTQNSLKEQRQISIQLEQLTWGRGRFCTRD